ncbi:hypothetical protein DNFV4_00961 [Nitrospira tepida]|uniref:DUF4331 domain-containing protein n=2 Tax=Nitrospira tepida TaxID=2973512 RepID=A0AA86T9U2_9BACT|nr:DUF4331 domain-containing protein [Nitrospira tepida]CAI4030533.1 hypothetical protein DNFV4_00961 [Nitrospira tepida]
MRHISSRHWDQMENRAWRTALRGAALCIGMVALAAGVAMASSHREAPFITELPKVDGTDFYMFRSYEPGRQDYVTLIANYLPLQAPYGGPNYFQLDPEALYEIHIDNNGDAREDLTFQFRFKNSLQDLSVPVGPSGQTKNISVPLINIGPISSGNMQAQNIIETYTIDLVRGNRRTGNRQPVVNAGTGSTTFSKPLDNIGSKSIPNYDHYANSFIHTITIPGCGTPGKVFVGQRKESFVVNLGEIFDLVNLNPLGPPDGRRNIIDDANITSLVLEVPIACVTNGSEKVIGGWTTASLRQARLLRPAATFDRPALEGGAWTQVSRLAMPLVNEIVIGLKDKNRFNGSKPEDDAQFADYVTNPSFPFLIQALFPSAPAPTLFPRADLVAAFLTGINTPATGNLNQPANVVASEMMRLNTGIAPTPKAAQNNLGVIGGDLAGFPNGRRPGDDVVDIELRVAMGKLISAGLFGNQSQAPAGEAPLTDGALVNASFFGDTFPYLTTPIPGAPIQ